MQTDDDDAMMLKYNIINICLATTKQNMHPTKCCYVVGFVFTLCFSSDPGIVRSMQPCSHAN